MSSVLVETIESANTTLKSADKTINSANKLITPETIDNIKIALKNFKSIMQKVDDPNIQEAIDAGHLALDNLIETLEKTNNMLEPNSPVQYNLIKMTGELEETARSIRSLVETLERNPRALIFGRDKKAKGD